jgi:protein subunit release factor B
MICSGRKMSNKEILFSVTEKDFEWSYTRGSGKGGQKRNKTSSAVHCKHPPSGAHGYSDATRSQHDNKIKAFSSCTAKPEFKSWLSTEIARHTGKLQQIADKVEEEMKHVKVEVIQDGKWIDERHIGQTEEQTSK